MSSRIAAWVLATTFALVPLFPPFIALTAVAFPGVSLFPRPFVLGVLGLGCVLCAFFLVLVVTNPRRGSQPLLLPALAWFGAALLSSLLGFDPFGGLLFVGIFGLTVLWHATIMRFYGEPGVARAIYWAIMLSGTVASAAAIAMVVTREPASQYAIQHGRATGTFILPGELAGYLIIFLPIAYALARIAREPALRLVAWIALATGGLALALTFSRAGWMGLAAAAAFLIAAQTRQLRRGASAALLIVAGGAGLVLLLFNAHHNPSEDYTRVSIWQAAAQIIDRFPLTGVGPFDFSRLYAIVRVPGGEPSAFHAHSVYLTFFAEMGIVGVIAVAATAWRFAVVLRARLAVATPDAMLLGLAVTAGLVGTAVQGLIDTVSVVIFGLWLATFALALAAAREGLGTPAA